MADSNAPVFLENSRIGFRNFAGEGGQFNAQGDRNFCVFLEPDIAQQMINDGWNVKHLKARDEDEAPQAYLQIKVNFANRPPRMFLVSSKGKTPINEDMVGIVDWAELQYTDLMVSPYKWNVNGKTGVKAYLKSAYFILQEDELDRKYIDVPDSAQNALTSGPDTLHDLGEINEVLELEG